MWALGDDGTRAKYVILRYKMVYFSGCQCYPGNSDHGYKENIELISKQSVLLTHAYHQDHGFYGYNRSSA